MTAREGRGRPPVFTADVQAQFLDAVRAGATLGAASQKVNVHRNVPTRHARNNEAFATALAAARTQGRQARIDDLPHDEYRYNDHNCRCRKCRNAAAKGRAGRRADTANADGPGELPAAAPQSPTSFLLPRRSSWTEQHAA